MESISQIIYPELFKFKCKQKPNYFTIIELANMKYVKNVFVCNQLSSTTDFNQIA